MIGAAFISEAYQDTKCVLSGENATFNTHEPCPDRVPAKLACWLKKHEWNMDTFSSDTNISQTT